MDILSILKLAAEKGTSDLHLIASRPPLARIDGILRPLGNMPELTPADIDRAFQQLVSAEEKASFEERLELDFGVTIPGVGRGRCNAARQRGSTSLVIRILPPVIPSLDELGLPEVCQELVLKKRGLVVVSGPSGSGKSTTLAAMVNYLNGKENRHIVTIEDPIENIFQSDKCTITQRELGTDTRSFAEALRHVLRQDPDVILVGEMRDLETASAVLTIAETGHLVLTTGHAPSAPQALERIIDIFPPHERGIAQARLASLLNGILCQVLVPKANGPGRIVATEVMLASPAIRNGIREGKIHQLPNAMMTQTRSGMILLDNALVNLYRRGLITRENALAFCNNPEEVSRATGGGGA